MNMFDLIKKYMGFLLVIGLLGATAISGAQAAVTVRLGHVGAPGSLFDMTAKEFAKRANAKLGDQAKVEVYGSSQLGNDTEMLRKLKLGTIDLSLPSTVMSSVAPEFALFEMPFLIKDRDQMAKVRNDDFIRGKLEDAAKSHGYKILGIWENGFRDITNNKRPIRKPEDLEGIKLRTPKGEWRVRMFKAYGANPTPMPYSEVFVGLQTGAVDGQENPLAQIYPAHFYEVQKYLSISHHVYTPAYLLAGASWQRLPEHVRKVLKETAIEMQPVALKMGAQLDKKLLKKLKDEGMEVNHIDRQAFVDASKKIYERFENQVEDGKKMVEEVRSLED
jgi:tripartite ATP-independent transporter DctP family solute receptor